MQNCVSGCVYERCAHAPHTQGRTHSWGFGVGGTSYPQAQVSHLLVTLHLLFLWRQDVFLEEALVDDIPSWEVSGHHEGGAVTR